MSDARVHVGDCRDVLRSLPAESVHCCVTSPPYWGLREYGIVPIVWDGDPACTHDWSIQTTLRKGSTNGREGSSLVSAGAPKTVAVGNSNDTGETKQYRADHAAFCAHCRAWRGQLGLEPTPELYVEHMVEVFREVQRVLRKDGTLWLNLGDCYATGAGKVGDHPGGGERGKAWRGGHEGKHQYVARGTGALTQPNRLPIEGLKPKDMVGIPWRVAFALQQPQYNGSIKDERDRIWLAAMLDAEGCLFIHKRKAGQSNGQGYQRQNDNYGPGLEISNTCRALVERIAALVGKGSICEQESGKFGRKQTLYRWNLRTIESRDFVREIYPYLVAKKQQARIMCGCPANGERAEAAHEALKLLHQGGETTVDFPAPASMFGPGWYLRSDIIWSKSNARHVEALGEMPGLREANREEGSQPTISRRHMSTIAARKITLRGVFNDEQMDEIRFALEDRREALDKLLKKEDDLRLSGDEIRDRLFLYDGNDAEYGLIRHFQALTKADDQADAWRDRRNGNGDGQMSIEESLEGIEEEAEKRIEDRRMRAALLEIAPSVTTDRVLSDDELTEAVARRWDGIEYIDNDAASKKDRRWPHVHKHSYNDADGAGVVWCAAQAKDLGRGTPEDVLLKFWYGIAADLFDPNSVEPMLRKPEILALYRELLGLPAFSDVVEESEPEMQPAGVSA